MFHTYNICFLIKYFEDILGVEKRGTCIVKDSETDLKRRNECLKKSDKTITRRFQWTKLNKTHKPYRRKYSRIDDWWRLIDKSLTKEKNNSTFFIKILSRTSLISYTGKNKQIYKTQGPFDVVVLFHPATPCYATKTTPHNGWPVVKSLYTVLSRI